MPSDDELQAGPDCKAVTLDSDKASADQGCPPLAYGLVACRLQYDKQYLAQDPETKTQVSSLMYDDGLARFSVFLEPLNGATVTDTRTQLGPTVARRVTTLKAR